MQADCSGSWASNGVAMEVLTNGARDGMYNLEMVALKNGKLHIVKLL
jgi:hypothetical protein